MKMTADKIRKLVTDTIVAALEAGTNPWQRPWTGTAGSAMPHNCITGHEYRGINVPYLWVVQDAKGYSTAQWLTFKQCKKAGGHVRKGEKSTMVVFTKPIFIKDDNDPGNEEKKRKIFMLRTFPVFNIEQTEDAKLPKREQPMEEDDIVPADELIIDNTLSFMKDAGATVKFNGGRAFYAPTTDHIEVPKPERFKSAEGFAATGLHELVHWTGHKDRLARVGITGFTSFGSEDYAFEELVAEIGAAMLCNIHGVSSEMPNHASYVQSWIKALKNDHSLIFKASRLSAFAVEFLIPELAEKRKKEQEEYQEAA